MFASMRVLHTVITCAHLAASYRCSFHYCTYNDTPRLESARAGRDASGERSRALGTSLVP